MPTSKSTQSRSNVGHVIKKSRTPSPLVSSPAVAKREIAGLRRSRNRIASSRTVAETDVRESLI